LIFQLKPQETHETIKECFRDVLLIHFNKNEMPKPRTSPFVLEGAELLEQILSGEFYYNRQKKWQEKG